MNDAEVARNEAVVCIERSFEVGQPPAGSPIQGPFDPRGEFGLIEKRFRGKVWTEVTVEDMTENRNLNGFSLAAFSYYLPAYLRLLVNCPDAADTLYEDVLGRLAPSELGHRQEAFEYLQRTFSCYQKGGVALLLRYILTYEEGRIPPDIDLATVIRAVWRD